MSRICPIFSGSTGNSTYISTSFGGILVDAGASYKGICNAISAAGGKMEELKAIFVTHEHIDHVKGLKVLLKQHKIPLIASTQTLKALADADRIPQGATLIDADSCEGIGEISVQRFATSHDCDGSSGYSFTLPDGKRMAVCTDLGTVTDTVRAALVGCDLILIESNHDVSMLRQGPYPPALKLRILSNSGHLSNFDCAAELPELLRSGTTRFILGHLSQKNNLPMLAFSAARAALMDIGASQGEDYLLSVARPDKNEVVPL